MALLSKLYTPGSAATIMFGDVPEGCLPVRLSAEPDDVHYSTERRLEVPPGPMHPVTERIIHAIHQVVEQDNLVIRPRLPPGRQLR